MKIVFSISLIFLLASFARVNFPDWANNQLLKEECNTKKDTFLFNEKDTLPYLLQFPSNYVPSKKLPLVVYLHSGNSKLKTLEILEDFGLPAAYKKRCKDEFIALSPLLIDSKDTWVKKASAVLTLIKRVNAKYKIDNSRVYITGHSLGSNGSLYIASVSKNLFAGIAVLGAGYFGEAKAPVISQTPVWLIHGENDENVPREIFDKTLNELKSRNNKIKDTIVTNYNHSMLLDLYEQDTIYNWLMSNRK